MAPFAEMRLVREARESARGAVEASGSDIRARAPSRKLLQASGLIKDEAAPWMTDDTKEKQAKLKIKQREKREKELVQVASLPATSGYVAEGATSGDQFGSRGVVEVGKDISNRNIFGNVSRSGNGSGRGKGVSVGGLRE